MAAPRLKRGDALVIASHNPGKVREIAELLEPWGISVESAAGLGLPEPVEDGETFEENALVKAREIAEASGKLALSDDSGLVVPALGGAPGIHSARWAGEDRDFRMAMERVWKALPSEGGREAHFVCVLALYAPKALPGGPSHQTYAGKVYGKLDWPRRGDKGFGYDPMFIPEGHDMTFGEMDPAEKHRISHRAEAFRALIAENFDA